MRGESLAQPCCWLGAVLFIVGCGSSTRFLNDLEGSAGEGGASGAGGSGQTTGGRMSCGPASLPADRTHPGYTPRAAVTNAVANLLEGMPLASKIAQMQSVPDPIARTADVFRDIDRSPDADAGDGKTLRGFRYRDAGRGVNLAAGQDNRPTQGNDFSTAFPAQSTRGASWDIELEFRVGEALGEETMSSRNNMLLAPCMNVLRHPYWGRSQETYGEDTFHLGRMASALTAGIQEHVAACAKHFAANNIENDRANQDARMDEQTLREIYGRHFEMVVRDGGVACVMAAYNSINGTHATQNRHLLTDVLREGFGFRGLVISEWWAMPGGMATPDVTTAQQLAREAVRAGLDVELPFTLNYSQLDALLDSQELTAADIDAAASRILEQKFRFGSQYTDGPYGLGRSTTTLIGDSLVGNETHLDLAEEVELKSAVLLTNGLDGPPVLPIQSVNSIAVIGGELPIALVMEATEPPKTGSILHLATDVNLGDRGSSRVNADPEQSIGPFAGIAAAAADHGILDVTTGASAAAALDADLVVVVVGLGAGDEGEEFSLASHGDRASLDLPRNQAALVSDVLALDKPTVIIVESGSIVNLPWLSHPNRRQATMWAGYGGQRAGAAFGKLLFGDANFSGKLPVSWPKEQDLLPFTSGGTTTQMGYFFGYRDYDIRAAEGAPVELVFPFGHGLSYSTFEYAGLSVPCADVSKDGVVDVSFEIANTGPVDGEAVAMLFVSGPRTPNGIRGNRAVKELKGFTKVNLKASGRAGSSERVSIPLRIDDLRHWEGGADGAWVIDDGVYTIRVGPSAADADLMLQETLVVHD
jgi:beta-glucosidase